MVKCFFILVEIPASEKQTKTLSRFRNTVKQYFHPHPNRQPSLLAMAL